ncbi:hypothetical protein [Streptomyces canus]|uniref:hypothetical protein n=1 Tax=Streptomyces canus TaxID=58343 RepID=UPI000365FD6B|nr:hypothetical protein [Streptomyces canus]
MAGGGLPASGAEAGEPAVGLLRGGLHLCLRAQALLLLALAFVGFGLLRGGDVPEAMFIGMVAFLPVGDDPVRMSVTPGCP